MHQGQQNKTIKKNHFFFQFSYPLMKKENVYKNVPKLI